MMFNATKAKVASRGHPPDSFLTELVEWGRIANPDIFTARPNPNAPNGRDPDVYALLKPILGPWSSLLHRRAAMLELMRVHAGFESSWNWIEGVDTTNQTSMTHREGQETGIFQVSYDSTYLANGSMKPFVIIKGINTVGTFITQMKLDHKLALEYYARLVRLNYQWAGPLKRHEVDPWLSPDAVLEFETLLS
jgi:hypothetical protein